MPGAILDTEDTERAGQIKVEPPCQEKCHHACELAATLDSCVLGALFSPFPHIYLCLAQGPKQALLPDSSPGSVSYSLTGKLAQFSEPRGPHLETGVQLGWPSKNTRKGPSTEQTLPEHNKWPSSTLCHHLPSPRPHLFGLESFPLTSLAGHSSTDNSHIASGPRRMPRPFL